MQVPDSGAWESSFTLPDAPPWGYWLAFSENHAGCELYVQEVFTIEAPSDTEPLGTGGSYPAISGIVELEVAVSDNAGIQLVEFYRWDAVNMQLIGLTTDSSAPYRASVEVNTLNAEWNEILAVVKDTAGNQAEASIFIYRQVPTITLDPIEGPPGTEVSATGNGWSAGHAVNVQWEDGTVLTTTTVDDNGNFTVSFSVPNDAAEGEYTLDFVSFYPGGGESYATPATFTVTTSEAPSFGPAGSFVPFGCNDGQLCVVHSQAHKEDTGIPTIQYHVHLSRIPKSALDLADKEHAYSNLKPGQAPMLMSKMQEALTSGFQKAERAKVQLLQLSKLSELIDTFISVAGGGVNLPAGLLMGPLRIYLKTLNES